MSVTDLPAVNALATRIHPDYPEDAAVFAERLQLYPAGCRVLEGERGLVAYVVSHPWRHLEPPQLNALLGALPPEPSTFYIHDLALAPEAQGTGAGADIVALLADHASASGLSSMSLIAVNGSAGFWQRQGFEAVHDPLLDAKLRSYGDDARFMARTLGAAGWHPSSKEIGALYERHATAFDRDRGKRLVERAWFERFRQVMPEGADVLDLGCGSGEPVARYLIEAGHRVTGVDSSPTLIGLCRSRFPNETWIAGDMREVSLSRRFGGIVAWNSFFHLTPDDQRRMFKIFRDHAEPGAALMFTSGPGAGEAIGAYQGEALYHASLATAEYEVLLAAHGFSVVQHVVEDQECGGLTVWLTRMLPG
ncbi:SAM-dependent methyltransferase [Afipia massiliensis]|uniref:SAM-dependent methyltransferase n=1 Tax=Afipia massiliensis TaxID=211460 RepID=A0A840MTW1_9BRAD|nr:SAM-dependent methyltransferase [Afipia massiliensis]